MRWITAILVSACLSTAARSQAPDSASHQQEGIAQLKQGHVQEALSEFRSAVVENPRDAVSHDYIGVILGESGQLDQALAEFEQAARLQPALPDPHFHLGLAYERTGRTNEAIAEYHEALRLDPAMLEARYGLSAICAKIGDLEGAIRLLREVIKAAPNFGEVHYNLGLNLWNKYKSSMGLRQKADLDDAQNELKVASQLQPSSRQSISRWVKSWRTGVIWYPRWRICKKRLS